MEGIWGGRQACGQTGGWSPNTWTLHCNSLRPSSPGTMSKAFRWTCRDPHQWASSVRSGALFLGPVGVRARPPPWCTRHIPPASDRQGRWLQGAVHKRVLKVTLCLRVFTPLHPALCPHPDEAPLAFPGGVCRHRRHDVYPGSFGKPLARPETEGPQPHPVCEQPFPKPGAPSTGVGALPTLGQRRPG